MQEWLSILLSTSTRWQLAAICETLGLMREGRSDSIDHPPACESNDLLWNCRSSPVESTLRQSARTEARLKEYGSYSAELNHRVNGCQDERSKNQGATKSRQVPLSRVNEGLAELESTWMREEGKELDNKKREDEQEKLLLEGMFRVR